MCSESRLTAINKATGELDRCVRLRGTQGDIDDRLMVTIGELDWLSELHTLLYGGHIENL